MTRDRVRGVVVLCEPEKWVGRFVCLCSCGGMRVACEVAAKGGSARRGETIAIIAEGADSRRRVHLPTR